MIDPVPRLRPSSRRWSPLPITAFGFVVLAGAAAVVLRGVGASVGWSLRSSDLIGALLLCVMILGMVLVVCGLLCLALAALIGLVSAPSVR